MKANKPLAWEKYEEVAAYLLNQFAEEFDLGRVEGKTLVPGQSGTDWELDARGWAEDGNKFVVVECKNHSKAGISQAITASLAFVIRDTGASGGILVSPMGLQAGGKKVAASADIIEVVLRSESTTTDYVIEFLNKIHAGFSDTVNVSVGEHITIVARDEAGNVVDTRELDG